MNDKDLDQLEHLGFFKHVPEVERASAREWARSKPHPFDPLTRRLYRADAEELAEGGVVSLLGGLAPFLRREGVPVEVTYAEASFPATKATATEPARPARRARFELDPDGWLAAEECVKGFVPVEKMSIVPQPEDPPRNVTEDTSYGKKGKYIVRIGKAVSITDERGREDPWIYACRRTLRILDDLLEAHGSPERAYGMYAGNDFAIAFLTPPMAKLLRAKCHPSVRPHDGGREAQMGWRPGP